jgi:hypothetical protein
MYRTIAGIYKNGRVELLEQPSDDRPARVIVTFLTTDGEVDLRERGIDDKQAADLRGRLRAFAEDWDRPEMDVYDAV